VKLYRNNNHMLSWWALPDELATQFWASRQAACMLRRDEAHRELAATVALWLRDPAAHGSRWDDRDGFNEVVAAVIDAWPLGAMATAPPKTVLAIPGPEVHEFHADPDRVQAIANAADYGVP
jgi:hypothetical protein